MENEFKTLPLKDVPANVRAALIATEVSGHNHFNAYEFNSHGYEKRRHVEMFEASPGYQIFARDETVHILGPYGVDMFFIVEDIDYAGGYMMLRALRADERMRNVITWHRPYDSDPETVYYREWVL